jgi:hypothetical protein
MHTIKYLVATTLVGIAAWGSAAPLMARIEVSAMTSGHETVKKSEAWLAAKRAFTPANEMRTTFDHVAGAASTDSTTMRLLGLGSDQDRTVFPAITDSPAQTVATMRPQRAVSEIKLQVVDVTLNPTKVAEQKAGWQQPEKRQQSSRDSEFVLLPSVKSVGSLSTFLVSSQSNVRIVYASRAFTVKDAIKQAVQDVAAGQRIQRDGAAQ